MENLTCFKAYDIRGELDIELNESIAYRIGRAYAEFLKPKSVVIGCDIRLTSEALKKCIANGIRDAGGDVLDIGMVGTEEVYFATTYLEADGGIEVTASHNPKNFNGMKLVSKNSKPISMDNGLLEIKAIAEKNNFPQVNPLIRGSYSQINTRSNYIDHILSYINLKNISPMRIVMNAGNGAAGDVINEIETHFEQMSLPIELIKINNEPDGTFPNGIPNPILIENRSPTIDAVIRYEADMGIAWDGDFDRCFLVAENGLFVEGYYIVGLLAKAFLKKNVGEKVVHDPRLTWNTVEIVEAFSGSAIQSKTGHAFIKDTMRRENAIYGGEMSAHHYFRDFFFCDSGMIPWLLIMELISIEKKPLSEMVCDMIRRYPSPGEINFVVKDPDKSIAKVMNYYSDSALFVDFTDGLSMEFKNWRFNLRKSNTEPLVRLNLESRFDLKILEKHKEIISSLLRC